MAQIAPHGGKLINRLVQESQRESLMERSLSLKQICVDERTTSDLEMIAIGGYSPIEGFMARDDYESVLDTNRLANGLVWTIPVTLAVDEETANGVEIGEEVSLLDGAGAVLAILRIEEKYALDKEKEANLIYGTTDAAHPGVQKLYESGKVALAGKVNVLRLPRHDDFLQYRLIPAQTREIFAQRGWRRVVGFQTRNPIHRAHEYIQKCALETVDGLLLHPLVGQTKGDDVPADIRMRSYEVILEKYYPKDRVLLAVMPAAMRYAGPKEAIFHAIIRKNYGCTHFIVGRDHAGYRNYYGPFDAHYIFDEFDPHELGITPLFFDNAFYCKSCQDMVTFKTCPHDSAHHVTLSGTKVRELLRGKQNPPPEITRAEVAEVLIEGLSKADYQI